MNVAQVSAYLQDDTPVLARPKPLSWWASRHVDLRKWNPLSVLQRTYPSEFAVQHGEAPRKVIKLAGRKGPVSVDGVRYSGVAEAAKAVGVGRDTISRWARITERDSHHCKAGCETCAHGGKRRRSA